MVSVSKAATGGYVVRWRDEAKAQHKRSFRRKLDADRYRAQLEHELSTGAYVDPAAGRELFRDYAERWRLAQPVRHNTARRHLGSLTGHVYPVLGNRRIGSIRPSEIQAFVTGLSGSLAPGSVRQVAATVSAIFRAAVRDRIIPTSPCDAVALPEIGRRQVTPLSVDQVEQLAAGMPPKWQALVIVGAGAGLRRGELLGLEVGDVDFLRGVIRVERQVQRRAGGMVVGPLKSRASYRAVPVGRTVTGTLAAHLSAESFTRERSEHVFTVASSRALELAWHRARTAAGLPAATLHDLRHFFASVLIGSGLSVKVVSARLGHSNAAMTLNVYAHLWPDDDDRSRQAVDAVFTSKINRGAPSVRPAGRV
jgi:integrase